MTHHRPSPKFITIGPPVDIWPPADYPTLIIAKIAGGNGDGKVGKIKTITSTETIRRGTDGETETQIEREWEQTREYCPGCGKQGLLRALDTSLDVDYGDFQTRVHSGDLRDCIFCEFFGNIHQEPPSVVARTRANTTRQLRIAFGGNGNG